MNKKMMIPTLICGALLITTSAFAWGGPKGTRGCDGFGPGAGPMGAAQTITAEQHQQMVQQRVDRMGTLLELSAKQKEQMTKIHNDQFQQRQDMQTKMQANRDALTAYNLNDKFNESDYRKLVEKQADLRTDMMVQRAKTQQQLKDVLTPEQQIKADKLQAMNGPGTGQRGGKHFRTNSDCPRADYGQGSGYGPGMMRGQGQRWM